MKMTNLYEIKYDVFKKIIEKKIILYQNEILWPF